MKIKFTIQIWFFAMSLVSAQNYWKQTPSFTPLKSNELAYATPSEYGGYSLQIEALADYLEDAPKEVFGGKTSTLPVAIPMPNGSIETFHIYESSMMMDGLQKKFAQIRSYTGRSVSHDKRIRFTVAPNGFFGAIATPQGPIYIDPRSIDNHKEYLSYYTKNDMDDLGYAYLACGVDLVSQPNRVESPAEYKSDPTTSTRSGNDPVDLRIYRMAIGVTAEWTARYGGTVEAGLAVVVSTMDRLNLIFENDLAIRMLLVDNNDQLIFTNPDSDPYGMPESGFTMLGENTGKLSNVIGANNFDIGHVYGLCTDTGGVAQLASACRPGNKGAGVSCFGGDAIAVALRVVSHEIGHQMGANHSFNNCGGGNENLGTGYEPGSGTTIMSYAGTCGSNNVSSNNDDYFHVISLDEMKMYMHNFGGNDCAQRVETTNVSPDVELDYTDGFFIPISTPFELKGLATDANSDSLTYTWEQCNHGPLSPLGEPIGNAPSFQSLYPSEDIARSFPSIVNVIFNRNVRTEVLPTYTRDYKFRLTARDNNAQGGGTDWEEVNFKATDQAGPFKLSYPSRIETLTIGQEINIEWDVANTDQAPIRCDKVDIYLSVDGGFNYDKQVAAAVPNDGSHPILVPNTPSEEVRFKIKAHNNIFYDISNLDSKIIEPSEPTYYIEAFPPTELICLPETIQVPIETASFLGYNEMITFDTVEGLPEGATYTFSSPTVLPSESTMLDIDLSQVKVSGIFEIKVQSTSPSGLNLSREFALDMVANDFGTLALTAPVANETDLGVLPSFSWEGSPNALTYSIEIATSPAFGESIVVTGTELVETNYTPPFTLEAGKLYYWRVSAGNVCGISPNTPIRTFHTIALRCETVESTSTPVNISASGTRTIEALISFSGTQISDVNVERVAGTHERVSDLKFTLISPDGIEIILANRKCGNTSNFDVGFDDEAPNEIFCPILGNTSYQPEEPLSRYINENANGFWTLRIDDLVGGAGGQVNAVSLEICSGIDVKNPFLVNNEELQLPPGASPRISTTFLKADDENNMDNELRYTLTTLPVRGDIVLNGGSPLAIGDTFTQSDINNGSLRYFHDGSTDPEDHFQFVLEDGEGGWIGITNFDIGIDADFSTSLEELEQAIGLKMFPNPVSDILYIQSDRQSPEALQIAIVDIAGRTLVSMQRQGKIQERISVSELPSGVYFLQIQDSNGVYSDRFVVE